MQKARRHHTLLLAPTARRRTVSGTISLPYLGCFSPFPYGTGSLSVSEKYLALPDGAGRFMQHAAQVWALPFSLATTQGIIIIFFSSSYLDVSVQRVDSPCGVTHLQCA